MEARSVEEDEEREVPVRLRRAETVLRHRCGRLCVVLDRAYDSLNHQATIRTAEALGIQHVWIVAPVSEKLLDGKRTSTKVTKGSERWLSIRDFADAESCIQALQEEQWEIWTTELSEHATPLDTVHRHLFEPEPLRVALIIGREADGVEDLFVRNATRRVYLPMFGFTESFNLSVACALILQRLLDWFPSMRGSLPEQEMNALRRQWLSQLVRNPTAALKCQKHLSNCEAGSEAHIEPLLDLRAHREEVAWVPPKIRKKEELRRGSNQSEEHSAKRLREDIVRQERRHPSSAKNPERNSG